MWEDIVKEKGRKIYYSYEQVVKILQREYPEVWREILRNYL